MSSTLSAGQKIDEALSAKSANSLTMEFFDRSLDHAQLDSDFQPVTREEVIRLVGIYSNAELGKVVVTATAKQEKDILVEIEGRKSRAVIRRFKKDLLRVYAIDRSLEGLELFFVHNKHKTSILLRGKTRTFVWRKQGKT